MPTPPDDERIVLLVVAGGALLFVALALASMATLHERHYRDRRRRILEAHLAGLEARVSTVENILREDRTI